jgi:hypothetical protein
VIPKFLSWPYRWGLCWVPIQSVERVLRLIPKDWYKPGKPVPFGRVAFEPNRYDDDGISLYRERWVTPAQLDASRPKHGTYYVIRLKVQDIYGVGLTLRRNVGDLPGHVVIPELRLSSYKENKEILNPLIVQLATLAGRDIVFRPSL